MKRIRMMGLCLVAVFAMSAVVAASASAKSSLAGSGSYIVTLKDSAGDPGAVAADEATKTGGRVSHVYRHALRGFAARIPADKLPLVQADPRVEAVVNDETFVAASARASSTECEICEIKQVTTRGARRIAADQSSTHSGDGQGDVNVNIAILDTGIQPDQPDLNVAGGVDCGVRRSGWTDHNGHGTFVAGVAAARDNAFGIVGVAPGAPLWAVRVLNRKGIGTDSMILCGIDWVTATRTDADPTNDIQVANMSLAEVVGKHPDDEQCGAKPRDVIHQAICRSTAAGVTYVVAASNEGADLGQFSPATYPQVLTMTAIADSDGKPGAVGGPNLCTGEPDDSAASFSNFATLAVDEAHTLAAPGVCISSTFINSRAASASGTSFASPFGAGTVALCIYSGPCAGLTPAQIVTKIVADAAAYNNANPGYGFSGDPLRPVAGKYYGYLIHAGSY